jgi:hypothetical protein
MRKQLFTLFTQTAIPGVLVCTLAFPSAIFSQAAQQDHVVTSQAMQQQLQESTAERQRNIETVTNFLSSPTALRAMHDSNIDPTQIKTAIPTLSNEELANLATRANDAQTKFAAGSFSNHDLLLLVLATLVIILIVVAVH